MQQTCSLCITSNQTRLASLRSQLLTSVLSDPPNGGSLVPLRENRARAFCGINVYMSFFVYINRPVSIIYVHHYAASLSECRYLGCVFCNLMYRYDEGRAKASCGIMIMMPSMLHPCFYINPRSMTRTAW